MKRRVRIKVSGRVQGVGFRPAVYRNAVELAVTGFVRNAPSGVIIEAEANHTVLERFVGLLAARPPSRSIIRNIEVEDIPVTGSCGFAIMRSARSGDLTVGMPPDLATCDDCALELADSSDRRHGYPFINCTNCGPRFTIIRGLPYDRERTSMHGFAMCKACRGEYRDPLNRRFDAQPDACAECGPAVALIDATGQLAGKDPIRRTVELLKAGRIVAIKGIGGYHLCCDALNSKSVATLRKRKHRPHKALAVMFRNLDQIKQYCKVSGMEKEELTSPARPIVILRRKSGCRLSRLISPDTRDVGAFLPYTPLHHLLLAGISPLVMTSCNVADEPIVKDEKDLTRIVGPIADFALIHNRPILRRCDDSVLRVAVENRLFYRRSRGYVPDPIDVPIDGPSVFGCGAELKNTFCLTRGRTAVVSQHIGDLTDRRTWEFYRESAGDLFRLLKVRPEIAAHDLHPDYLSTRYAAKSGAKRLVAVQHHHAHIAACMAEHGIREQVIGVALDGSGLGDDGTLWGGEFMLAEPASYRRLFHFKQYPMPGGDEAVRHPERMALSCLLADTDCGEKALARLLPGIVARERRSLTRMIEQRVRSPLTSSAGRLFDAVSAMLGLCDCTTYEGQAAIRLQNAAKERVVGVYPFSVDDGVLDFGPMIRKIVADIDKGADTGRIAAMFHNTVAGGVVAVCEAIRSRETTCKVALSGGVFQNDLLLKLVTAALLEKGFEVYSHHILPPNDACISVGQAYVALAGE